MSISVSRRSFVTGAAALGTAAAAGATLGTVASALADEAPDDDWLGEPPVIDEADVVETIDTEVLVVGAGQAGTATAAFAAAGGADVVWIDANGTGVAMRSSAFGAVNSAYQAEVGVSIDPEDILNDYTAYALNQCNQKLWRDWIDNSAEAVAWFGEMVERSGQRIALEYTMPPEGRYAYWPTGHGTAGLDELPDDPEEPSTSSGNEAAVHSVIREQFAADGGTFLESTALVELIQDEDGAVTGAYATNADGDYIRINASKGTVVATGGYVNNKDMYLARQANLEKSLSGNLNFGSAKGDGIKAMIWAGGHFENFPTTMIFDRGIVRPDYEVGQAFYDGEFGFFSFTTQPFLKVDSTGKRICNESSPYDYVVHAAQQRPGRAWFPIWDSSWKEDVQQFKTVGCSTLYSRTGSNHHAPGLAGVEGQMAELVENGYIQQADTLEELAEKLGFDVDTFVAEVEKYNGWAAAGKDSEYGKDPYRLSALDEPPFYGVKVGGLALCTLDGIVTNDDYQVVDDDLQPIPGLYTVGNDQGGWYAHSYTNQGAGTNAGRSATTGMLLGKALAAK